MCICFFFNVPATPEINTYGHTLSLHDALPISSGCRSTVARFSSTKASCSSPVRASAAGTKRSGRRRCSRTSTTSGHSSFPGVARRPRSEEHTSELQSLMRISYAVFCLKKKKKLNNEQVNNKRYQSTLEK